MHPETDGVVRYYGSFSGEINAGRVTWIKRRLNQWAAPVSEDERREVCIFWSSNGGEVDSALDLYEFFKTYPLPITIFATVAKSAGAIAFFGAKTRRCATSAEFMLHGVVSIITGDHITLHDLRQALALAERHNERVVSILDTEIDKATAALLRDERTSALYFSAKEAGDRGFLTGHPDKWHARFAIPCGSPVVTLGDEFF